MSSAEWVLNLSHYAPIAGAIGLIAAVGVYRVMARRSPGTGDLPIIAGRIEAGAMAFLRRQYTVLLPVLVVVAGLLSVAVGWPVGLAFELGGVCSLGAGFIGMRAATKANVRTAEAARAEGAASGRPFSTRTCCHFVSGWTSKTLPSCWSTDQAKCGSNSADR